MLCSKGRVGSSPTPGTQATIGLPDGSPPAYSSWLPSGRVLCHLPSGVRWIRKPFCFQRLCLPHYAESVIMPNSGADVLVSAEFGLSCSA